MIVGIRDGSGQIASVTSIREAVTERKQVLGAEAAERPAGAEIGVCQASPFWRAAHFSSQWMS